MGWLKAHLEFFLFMLALGVTILLHWAGAFDVMELKLFDRRMATIRGPLQGWSALPSREKGQEESQVVLVLVDDEAWRLVPESWPYSRGQLWADALLNLSKAGAKVVAFDIQFDAPDMKSEYMREFFSDDDIQKMPSLINAAHGDSAFGKAIIQARELGTEVVINAKIVNEPSLNPPQYLALPVEDIMKADPETGIINDYLDEDGFLRRYAIAGFMDHEPEKAYLTLGLKCLKLYAGVGDSVVPFFHRDKSLWEYGPYKIKSVRNSHTFFINYAGPASAYASGELQPWGTFPCFSLARIIDTRRVDLRVEHEDIDWMEQYLPGELPAWLEAIDDPDKRTEIMERMGFSKEGNTESPFKDKIVLIGVSVEAFHDYKSTPFYNYEGISQFIPGVEAHANAIETILEDNYIHLMGGSLTDVRFYGLPWVHVLLALLATLFAFLFLSRFNPFVGGGLLTLFGVAWGVTGYSLFMGDMFWWFKKGLHLLLPDSIIGNWEWAKILLPEAGNSIAVPIVMPLAALIIAYVIIVLYRIVQEQQQKKFLKDSFGTYISPDLIQEMYEHHRRPELGGVKGFRTVLFSDIQSFTTISEQMDAAQVVALMNEYLSNMTTVLLDERGTLDKYIGDAIIAFWGAPVDVEYQEYHACATALAMRQALEKLKKKWAKESWPDDVKCMHHRIGLNCGEIVTGNMGSDVRMNYTMMGDDVNLGARLESSAKQYGVDIHVSEKIVQATREHFEFRFLDKVTVKGKKKPVCTYELLGKTGELTENQIALKEIFEKGIKAYHNREWDKAEELFLKAEEYEVHEKGRVVNPSMLYVARCNLLREEQLDDTWDGVWHLDKK